MGSSQSFYDRDLSTSKGVYSFINLEPDQDILLKYRVFSIYHSWKMLYILRYNLHDISHERKSDILKLCKHDINFYKNLDKNNGCYVIKITKNFSKLPFIKNINNSFFPFDIEISLCRNKITYTFHHKFESTPTTYTDYEHLIPECCWTADLELTICNDNANLDRLHTYQTN